VTVNTGTGFVSAPIGTTINFTIVSGPGSLSAASCTTTDASGSCSVTLTSTVTGVTVLNAATTVTVSGVSLTRATGDANAGDGPDATKTWLSISVDKTAAPVTLVEPGGSFTFNVTVTNHSTIALTLTSLKDNIYGDLNGKGTCAAGGTLGASGTASDTYTCSFQGTFTGVGGASQTDIVTAVATDANGTTVTGQDDATVTLTPAPVVPVPPPPGIRIVSPPSVTISAPVAAGGGGGGGGASAPAPSSEVAAARSQPQNRIAEVLPARLPSTGNGGAEGGSGIWLAVGASLLTGGLVLGLAAFTRRRRTV